MSGPTHLCPQSGFESPFSIKQKMTLFSGPLSWLLSMVFLSETICLSHSTLALAQFWSQFFSSRPQLKFLLPNKNRFYSSPSFSQPSTAPSYFSWAKKVKKDRSRANLPNPTLLLPLPCSPLFSFPLLWESNSQTPQIWSLATLGQLGNTQSFVSELGKLIHHKKQEIRWFVWNQTWDTSGFEIKSNILRIQ